MFEKLWNLMTGYTKSKPTTPDRPQVKQPQPATESTPSSTSRSVVPVRRAIVEEPTKQTASPLSDDRRRSRGDRTIVIVGFDFGTHSTKVLYRKRNEDTAKVLSLGDSVSGYPGFATPSLVRLVDGVLWFGGAALTHTQGTLYRSLKVRLLGRSAEPDEPYPAGPCPDMLVAAYLAWAFKTARNELDRLFTEADVRLNLAAPMDHLEDPRLKTRFLQIVQAAWNIAFDKSVIVIDQGVRLDVIEHELQSLLSQEVVDASERTFDVLPETVAPIVSLSMDPRMAPDMYLIVDIGAGTTEISINHSNEQGVNHRVLCYFDQTVVIGGDRFSQLTDLAADGRGKKCETLVSEIVKACVRVWATGYQKDSPNHVARQRWRNLVILLAGGGTRHPAVIRAFESSSRQLDQLKFYQVNWHVMSHSPANVDLGGSKRDSTKDLSLLAVAQGLTRERQTWPIVFEPASVETLQATAAVDRTDSFWYVGGK